ncbi:uncharacterized protein LOC110233484, partial [Exaiptasia diaphana]|uniref:Uncharacterized protein n=1 Tax=Exaiptasia diaphana TaxID=2652724 RepID=A0A913WUS8_EXADI
MDEDMDWNIDPESKEPKERQRKPRNHAGPLPKAIYDLFLTAVRAKKLNKTQYPSGPELKAIGFPKPIGGHTRRERFKHWAERMDCAYNPETGTDSLIHKRTGKIIIPLEEFENVIRGIHENNGEKHNDLKTTLSVIQDKYTIGGRAFGMNRGVVR